MNKIGVLFDLDGVLIDSESVYTKFWAAAEKLYPPGIDNFAIKIKGTTLPDILSRYFPDIEVQKKLMKMINDFEASMQYIPFEEAMRFVDELSAANIPTAIVTSSSKLKMEKLYAQNPGFKEKFNAVITSDLVTYSKPHPQPYLLGAEALGVAPQNCFVFEDSLLGIESGNNAGATVIGLATTLPYSQINGKARKTINDFSNFHLIDMLNLA